MAGNYFGPFTCCRDHGHDGGVSREWLVLPELIPYLHQKRNKTGANIS